MEDLLFGDFTFVDGLAPLVTGSPGTYGSYEPLSVFEGEDIFGTWTIELTDTFTGSGGGELNGFTMNVTMVPAPGVLAFLGAAGPSLRCKRRR